MKKWSSLVFGVISAVVMYLLTSVLLPIIASLFNGSASATELFISLYWKVTYVMMAITVLCGLWGVFKRAGNTAMVVWGVLLIVLGGAVLYLVPAILVIIGGSIGKKKFNNYYAELQYNQE